MLKRLILIAAMITLGGCVSTKVAPLDTQQIARFQGGTITVSHREKPVFMAQTAGKATFALVGAAAMVAAGNKIVADNAVEDPAVYIAQQLAAELALTHALVIADNGGVVADSMDVNKLARQYSKADLLLDVQTADWTFVYFPTDWNSYQVIYRTKLRLIDTKSAKMVAEGYCERVPGKTSDAPSYNELVGNGAAGLKQRLASAAKSCVEELRRTALAST